VAGPVVLAGGCAFAGAAKAPVGGRGRVLLSPVGCPCSIPSPSESARRHGVCRDPAGPGLVLSAAVGAGRRLPRLSRSGAERVHEGMPADAGRYVPLWLQRTAGPAPITTIKPARRSPSQVAASGRRSSSSPPRWILLTYLRVDRPPRPSRSSGSAARARHIAGVVESAGCTSSVGRVRRSAHALRRKDVRL